MVIELSNVKKLEPSKAQQERRVLYKT